MLQAKIMNVVLVVRVQWNIFEVTFRDWLLGEHLVRQASPVRKSQGVVLEPV